MALVLKTKVFNIDKIPWVQIPPFPKANPIAVQNVEEKILCNFIST